jgi:prolyl oligopeptidase
MKKEILTIFVLTSIAFQGCMENNQSSPTKENPKIDVKYIETRADATAIDDYHGTKVADPYRWLEADTSAETGAWVKAQNGVTQDYLSKIPFRDAIKKRYSELYNFPKVSSPQSAGEYYFFYKNDGLQNQAVIYRQKGQSGQPEMFIDPNKMSSGGTMAVNLLGFSKDKKYVAVSQSAAGSDWQEIHVREIATNRELPDLLKWVKFSGAAWCGDGFFYSRFPTPKVGQEKSGENSFHAVYFHKLGDDQKLDKLIYENKKQPKIYHGVSTSEDQRWLFLTASTGTDGYETYFKDLQDPKGTFKPIFKGFEHKNGPIEAVGGKFLMITDVGAPKYRIVEVDPAKPEQANWKTIVAERENLLETAATGGGKLFCTYLKNATTRISQFNLDGSNEKEVELPSIGTASQIGGEMTEKQLFYTFTNFTNPGTIYQFDVETGKSVPFFKPELKFNPDDFETKQVFYPSKDGTKVSMFVVHKKGLKMDGSNPTYLYGYGGFNIPLTPSFSTSRIILLENGGVFAMPNLRGGGEYGEEWHKAGMLDKKQNVFDDFIAAAEYLVAEKYTNKTKLAIAGGSNGGLLVGAAMTQRPDLFAAAFPAVGVMDMLKFHKFTIGWGWVPEYGSSDDPKQFEFLKKYSPLHNFKAGTEYPATLVTTGDHDDRVVPAHSFKFAAALQKAHKGDHPALIRIETDAGHGAGKPTSKIIDEQADIWSFFFWNTNSGVKYLKQ